MRFPTLPSLPMSSKRASMIAIAGRAWYENQIQEIVADGHTREEAEQFLSHLFTKEGKPYPKRIAAFVAKVNASRSVMLVSGATAELAGSVPLARAVVGVIAGTGVNGEPVGTTPVWE